MGPARRALRMRPPSQYRVPRAWVLPCLVVLALLAAPLREADVATPASRGKVVLKFSHNQPTITIPHQAAVRFKQRLLPTGMRDRGVCPSLQSSPCQYQDWEATMHNMTSAQAEQHLTDLADQFAHWRQQRTYRFAPIPLPLWEQAIALTAVLPLASVAKRLGVRGRDLHKRCAARPEGPGAEPGP